MIDIDTLPGSDVNELVYRVILTRYPQISLFERVSNPQDWDVLYAVESLTNPRLRDEVGDIRLVPPEDRVYGDGASWIMAAFTHPPVDGRGGRFNRDFGIYCHYQFKFPRSAVLNSPLWKTKRLAVRTASGPNS